jgi:adenylate cyclase
LQNRFLSRPDWAVPFELLATLLFGGLIALASAFFRPWQSVALGVVAAAGVVGFVAWAFVSRELLLDATFPVLALTLTFLFATAFRLAITDKEGRNMRRMFGHYVAPSVLADIERNPQNLKLGGEVRDVTIMFLDIANFTPLSEKLAPEELVNTVNGLWNVCSRAILVEQGTIDKFIGDAIMAFWNAPVEQQHHQYRAAKAALAIRNAVRQYSATPDIKTLLAAHGIPPISVRIGLATGPACVGNMGSSERFDYSVLGETVNTAARTESTCKQAGHDILIAGRLDAETAKLATLQAGRMEMKGKSKAELVHAIIGDEAYKTSETFRNLKKEHDFLTAKLAQQLTARNLKSIRQLLDEMALHNPDCASYLRAIADRTRDFAVAKP